MIFRGLIPRQARDDRMLKEGVLQRSPMGLIYAGETQVNLEWLMAALQLKERGTGKFATLVLRSWLEKAPSQGRDTSHRAATF